MAFLHPIRLTFAGRFQADVSTVNNDVRHFADDSFRPNFQELQTRENPNGWWNPTGSGAFRFIDCQVTGVAYADGTTAEPGAEPLLGATIAGAGDRTAGKLVDIDPQWQLASQPWGLGVRLVAGRRELLTGEYRSHAFRDLWFSRNVGSGNDGAASSTFQSILYDVDYATDADSRFLTELRKASADGRLSIRLTTFGYNTRASSPTFTLGTMIGTIGPCLENEPESFILGRRFAPASGFSSFGANITYFSGLLDRTGNTLLLDLSNALQIVKGDGTPNNIGTLTAGILLDDSLGENDPVTEQNYIALGEIPYTEPRWLQQTGGIWSARLDTKQASLAADHPLALTYRTAFDPGSTGADPGALGVVAIRETAGGLLAGAEPSVVRLDAGDRATVSFWSARYGDPTAEPVRLRQLGAIPNQGAGTQSPDVDSIPIPDIGVPTDALTVPASVTTTRTGGPAELVAGDPGHPRGYLEGQVYVIDYRLPGQGSAARQPFDYVVVHVRDAYEVPDAPTWEDARKVLTQYGNLYPIMSRGFIDLGDEADVRANRDLLILCFEAAMTDPNHMPVTRDLSEPKRRMLLAYLASIGDQEALAVTGAGATGEEMPGERPVVGHRPAEPIPPPPDPAYEPPVDSKSRFATNFLRGGRLPRGNE